MFEIDTEVQVILFLSVLFLLLAFLLFKNLTDKNKGGGGFITMGATYELQTKNQRAAIQEIVEVKANKKMEEETSSDTNTKWVEKNE